LYRLSDLPVLLQKSYRIPVLCDQPRRVTACRAGPHYDDVALHVGA
jgi:hypothetical protein